MLDWYYPRKYTEVTNNVWSVNYMAQHDIRTQTAILRQTQQISNDDEVTDWTWNNVSKYYFHTYMFWDLECYHHGYWAELDTMYRKGTTGNAAADAALKNISDEYEKLAVMSSLITGLDLTYYFQRWDYVKATPSAAYTSAIASLNLKKEQPKLWYSDWDSYNDSTSTAVGKANKVNVENITTVGTTNYISCSTHYNVRNEHMGYEVAREGKVVGFTYDQIFEDKGIDPSKDYTYTVTAYDRAHAPYATATVNKSSCTNTAAAKIGTTTYQSLEDAIAAASSGDKIILMRSVVMFKGVNLDGKKLKISAGDTSRQYYIMDRSGTVDLFKLSNGAELQFSGLGKDNIVICGTSKGGTKSAFSLSGGSSLNFSYTKVKDFKGSSGGSLVYLANSNLTLSGAVLTNNEVSGSSMIYIGGSSTMNVKNDSVLQYNSANSNGVPVYVDGTNAAVNLTNCLIYRNDASGDHKGGIFYVEKGALNAAYGTRFMGNLSLGFCNCAAATICENGHLTLSNNAYIGDSVMISGPVNIGSGFTGEATLFVPSGLNKEGFVAAVGTGKQTLDPSVLSRLNYQTEQYKLVCADGKVVLAKGSDKVYGRVDVRYVDASTGEEIVLRDKKYYNVGESYAVAAKKISGYTYDGQKPSNASGKTSKTPVTVTYRYNKAGSQTSDSSKLKIHYYNANNWSKVGCYVYSESGSSTKEYTGKWPGKVMNADTESGWFYLEVDAANAKVIFNNNQASNGSQEPSGVGTPGYDVSGEVFIKNQKISRAGTVKVRYAADTGELLAGETIHGSADGTSTYTTTAKTIEGYTLKTTPTNAKGTITAGETTVTYVYTKAPVKVEYVALDKTSVSVNAGEKATLKSTVIPSNADNPRLGYSSANTAVATVTSAGVITGVSSGTTTVTAKSADGAVSKVTVTVKGEVPLTNQGTISEVKVPKCTWVTLKGAATGGKSGYKYAFYYKKITSSAWTSVGEIYGNQTQVMFGPAAVGTYKVKINVKDAAGTVVSKIFTLTSTAPTTEDLQNKSTLSAKSIVKDKPITITGKATGGSGSYTYAFYYKKTTSKAFTAIGTEYGTSTKAVFTPASKAAYNVRVNVKDSTGRIVTLQYMLPVAEETSSTLVNNSTISASEVKKGTKVTLTAKASGGSGNYRYAFYYKKSTSNNWTVIGTEYDTNATASFTPAMAAVYNVKINVMDSTGAMLEKTFAVISNN